MGLWQYDISQWVIVIHHNGFCCLHVAPMSGSIPRSHQPGCDQHSHLLEGVKVLDVDALLCVQLETCAVKIHKKSQECWKIHRNGSPDFSNQSNTIQNNKKNEKRWGDKCWQSFARLLRSMMVLLYVQAQSTPTMPNSTIC